MELTLPKLNAKFLNTVIFPRPKKVKFYNKPENCLRLVTFNVHFGQDISAIVDVFKQNSNLAQADIILLQEIEHHTKESMPRAAQIAKALRLDFVYVPARKLSLNRGTHGLAILSKLPLSGTKAIRLPVYKLLRLRPRVAVGTTVEIFGKKIKIYNVHLNGPLNYHKRVLQLRAVLNHIYQDVENQMTVLAGDFNTIPMVTLAGTHLPLFYSNQKKKLNVYLKSMGFDTRCQSVGHTYVFKKGLARFQLDGIYTKSAPLVQFGLERSVKVSDHFPLWADIKIS